MTVPWSLFVQMLMRARRLEITYIVSPFDIARLKKSKNAVSFLARPPPNNYRKANLQTSPLPILSHQNVPAVPSKELPKFVFSIYKKVLLSCCGLR
ncbi:hypothetical protein EYC80_001116 [Monilinia laxa]|uniref:Uncharacterized protein n=1 Tax=Monilinia laxa TaxID=61186 RepID=A0A5N6K880_MONLA|nr:hypothetical protein EYC80_001116 [Monilinia laxa]